MKKKEIEEELTEIYDRLRRLEKFYGPKVGYMTSYQELIERRDELELTLNAAAA